MVTLTLIASGDDDFNRADEVFNGADEVFRLAKFLSESHPASAHVVGIIVDNYIDCLQSLLDDWNRLGDAS